MAIVLKRGDQRTAIKATLLSDGVPCDLTDVEVKAYMRSTAGRRVIERDVTVEGPGQVLLPLTYNDVEFPGTFWLEFKILYKDGRRETYPTDGFVTVEIIPDLGGD